MRGDEQLSQLSRLQAACGGVLCMANGRSFEISWHKKKAKAPQHYYLLPNQFDSVTTRPVMVERDGF